MQKLRVSDELGFPLDAVTSTLLVYGGKGMGKTNLGSVFVEELGKVGLRFSVLDPMGVWWGLRHSADGKGPGVPCLILGGPHGDIPIEPTGGAVVADLVVNEDVNVIIDFSRKVTGEMWGIGEKLRFVADYGARLFQQQGSLVDGKRREPLFQMVDEAARFMPQTVRQGEIAAAMCLSTWATMVEEGRNVGLGIGLLTQRSARLNKDVAELADVMIAFRTVGPNSIAAVMDWLGEHCPKEKIKGYIESVRSLPRGTALVVSPGWLGIEAIVPMRARETFDSSATPKPGEKTRKVSGRGAAPDLGKYADRMKETIERAKADDPRELRKQLAAARTTIEALQGRVVTVAGPTEPDPKEINRIRAMFLAHVQQVLDRRFADASNVINAAVEKILDRALWTFKDLPDWIEKDLSEVRSVPVPADQKPQNLRDPRAAFPAPRAARPPETHSPAVRPPDAPGGKSDGFSASQRDILQALADGARIGRESLTRTWVAFLAGVSPKSSGFEKNLSTMRTRGVIDYGPGSTVFLLEEGKRLVPAVDNFLTEDRLHDKIRMMVSSSQASIMSQLFELRGKPISRVDLAEACNVSPNSSGFEKNLSSLRSLKLIDYGSGSTVYAVDDLFLMSRR